MRLLLAILLLPSLVLAYTSPGKPSGFVNDFAKLLTQEEVLSLEGKLKSFSQSTGNEIAVVTVESLGGDTIENFAVKLFEEWQIGKAVEDNGLLLLISKEDRQVRIEVGYGLEPYLTDIEASSIIENILVPEFKTGNYFVGIESAVGTVQGVLTGEMTIEPNTRSSSLSFINNYLYFIVLVLMSIASIMARSKSWWFGGIFGGVAGVIVGLFKGFVLTGFVAIAILVPIGLLLDFLLSKNHNHPLGPGGPWFGGGGRGGLGGGFGGFGGGSSGGGGASGRW